MTDRASENSDELPRFAELANTSAELNALFEEKPHSWRWAAFVSVLVRRRAELESQLRDHRLGYAPASGDRISNRADVVDLVQNTADDVGRLSQQLNELVLTSEFMAVFGPQFSEEGADPVGIVHNANRVMDLYHSYIDLARRVRGTSAPAEHVGILNDAARLVDQPLAGMDQMIDDYVDVVARLPDLVIAAQGKNFEYLVALELHVDNDLWYSIVDRVNRLDD